MEQRALGTPQRKVRQMTLTTPFLIYLAWVLVGVIVCTVIAITLGNMGRE
jgi:hypothetical protein